MDTGATRGPFYLWVALPAPAVASGVDLIPFWIEEWGK